MEDQHNDSRGEARHSFFVKQQLVDSARAAFQLLSAILKNAALYPESHPVLLTVADKLKRKIEDLLIGRSDFSFYCVDGELFFEKTSIPIEENLSLLMEYLAARHIGGIVFKAGVDTEELIRFARLVNRDPAFFAVGQADINEALFRERIFHIELHNVHLLERQMKTPMKAGRQKASDVFKDAVDTVKNMVLSVQQEKFSPMRRMNLVVQTMVDHILEDRSAFLGLTNIRMYDEYTFAHSVNVALLAVSLGTFLSLEKSQIAALGVAGLMHDIGKVNVPSEIINKPGALTDEEWEALKRHPVEGALILSGTPALSKMAIVAAFEHHQHSGARGYPLMDGEISPHPFSQIVSLADAYDAITAARVYYTAQIPPDQAIRILIQKRGTSFNPFLVNTFVKMVGVFPVGTVVRLDTGETGLVKQQTSKLLRPRVLVLSKFDGSEKENGLTVSLLETRNGVYTRSVAGTIDPSSAHIDVKKYFD